MAPRKPSMYELRAMNKKLEALNVKCGGQSTAEQEAAREKDEYGVDDGMLRNMTPFEREELKLAVALRQFRDTIDQTQTLSKGMSSDELLRQPRLARMRQSLRKMEMDLKPKQRAMIAAAGTEDEKRRCKDALGHLATMRKRYDKYRIAFQNQTYGSAGGRDNDDGDGPGDFDDRRPAAGGGLNTPMLATIDDIGQTREDLRQDEEFALFFEQITKNDKLMDQALDRIAAGVQALHQNAVNINQELKVQATIMNETENKVAATTAKLETLNKRVKRAVKDVQSDRLCMYMICFLLILALVGFILYQTGVVKK